MKLKPNKNWIEQQKKKSDQNAEVLIFSMNLNAALLMEASEATSFDEINIVLLGSTEGNRGRRAHLFLIGYAK